MNSRLKIVLVIILSVIVGVGAVTYGATTAPKPTIKPAATIQPLSKSELNDLLKLEQPTITGVLIAQYPKIATDYLINQGQLFDRGQWYGTTLTYKGSDVLNRDTLRVLMQKKQGVWILRTSPPELVLSHTKFPDVPKSILKTINKPISLPSSDPSPAISVNG